MAYFSTKKTAIKAIYSCVPKKVERTQNYEWISPAERTLFEKTTGIVERRVADENTTCSDLCFEAAKKLIKDSNSKDEIELLLFVSQSPDYFLPSTAVILHQKLGLAKTCMAFDINLGCSGYVYGLSVASQFIQSGAVKKALLLAGDKSTISTNYQDKSTYPLFGDAGTATLLSFDEQAEDWNFLLFSDGSGKEAIIIEDGHSRNPYGKMEDNYVEYEPGVIRTRKHLKLQGIEVFNFALKEVAPSLKELYEKANKELASTDFFVFHQANKLINESVRKKLKVEADKTPLSIDEFGNTSSASIPLTITTRLVDQLDSRKEVLFSGFGVGFSWANVLLKLENPMLKHLEYAPTLE